MKHSTKFYKHIFLNILFISTTIIAIFFALYLKNEYSASHKLLVQSYSSRSKELSSALDDKLTSGINILNQISANDVTQKYISLKKFEPYPILNFYNYISTSASVIPHTEIIIGVYNPALDMIVSNQGSYPLENFLTKFNLKDECTIDNFVNSNSQTTSTSHVFLKSYNHQDYLWLITQKESVENKPLIFMSYSINSLIQNFKNTSISDLESLLIEPTIGKNKEASNPRKNIFLVSSNVFPVNYRIVFSHVSTNILFKSISHSVIPLSIILGISLFLIFKFSNRVYKPVKALISSPIIGDHPEEIVDEFEYICHHVENLKNTLSNYNISTRTILLKEILYGIKKENAQKSLQNSEIYLFNKPVIMLLISAHNTLFKNSPSQSVQGHIEYHFTKTFTDLCEYTHYKMFNISASTVVLLVNSVSRENLSHFFESLTEVIDEHYIIITKPLLLQEASSKFYQLNDLIRSNKIANNQPIILEEDLITRAKVPYAYSESRKKLLIYYITNNRKVECLDLLYTILNENLFKLKLSKEVHYEFLSSICLTLTSLTTDLQTPNELLNQLVEIEDYAILQEKISQLFSTYCDYINKDCINKDLKYHFKDYIHTHYNQDISLADMANEFNLAINYVGVLFKEKTSYNFKDYLNTYRINVAKQILLETPNIKIKELSIAVGFINTNTFIRIFKKYEDISPGQYQKYILDTQNK